MFPKCHLNPIVLSALLLLFVLSGNAEAVIHFYSPHVDYQEVEVELFGAMADDNRAAIDGAQEHALALGYGFTQHWKSEIEVEFEKMPGGDLEAEAVAWENVFQIGEQGQYWVDPGVLVEIEMATESGNPDEVELGLLLEKDIRPLNLLCNLLLEKEFGDNAESEVEFAAALQTRLKGNEFLEPTIEFLTSEYETVVGPGLAGTVHFDGRQKVKYELGLLFGLTDDTPDRTLRWMVEYEF